MFAPSVGSGAHSPSEFTRPDDLANGVQALTEALRTALAQGGLT